MILYLLNKKQKAIKAIPSERLVEAKYTEGINEASKLTFSVPLESRLPNSAFFALFQKPDSSDFLLFKINDEAIESDRISYTGVDAAYDELKSYSYVKDMRPEKRTAKEILQRVLQDTRWEVGYIDSTGLTDTNFYYQPCLECIQKIAQIFNMEVVFTYGFDSKYQTITSRKVNLYQQQGRRTGKRFEYGSNLLTVTREEDSQDIVTALVGRGKGEEKTDEETGEATGGYGRRIDFSNVVWSKANGDPADKPAGQEYVEDVQATKIFGYDDGKPRIGIVVFENIEDPAELLKATWASLKSSDRPKVSFKASVTDVGNLGLGDTIAIIRHELGIEYFTRVFKVTHDLLDKQNNTVEMGDDLSGNSLTSYVSNVDSLAQSAQQQATNAAVQAGSKSKNIYSNTKPQFADEGDNLFLNLGNGEFEYWVWHNHQWVFIQSTQDLKNVEQNVKEAQQDLAKAKADIQKNGSDINNSKLEFNRSIGELNRSIIDFNQQTQQDFAETKDDIDNSKQEFNRSISQLDKEIKDSKKINADNYSVIVGKISTLEDKSKIKIKTNAINANDFTESGTYFVKSTGNSNVPKDSWFYLTVVKAEDGRITQTWQNDQDANERYTRLKVDNTWRNWEKSASYNEFSQLSQTVSGINTKVINNSGDISSLNQVAKGIQTDVANNSGDISSLKQTAKGLQTKVADNAGKISSLTQSVDGVQVEVKNANSDITTLKQTAKGLQTKVDGNSTKLTTITQTVEGVKVTAEDGLKKATELSQTVDGLKTKVEAGIDKSEITQLKDQIDLKVSKGDVLSEINLEAGTSLIKSNKIYLDSDSVVFSGKAFIPDAAIANISADKINAGTLDAGKINVININADNIHSGTIVGNNSSWNLATGFLNIGDADNYVSIHDGQINLSQKTESVKSYFSISQSLPMKDDPNRLAASISAPDAIMLTLDNNGLNKQVDWDPYLSNDEYATLENKNKGILVSNRPSWAQEGSTYPGVTISGGNQPVILFGGDASTAEGAFSMLKTVPAIRIGTSAYGLTDDKYDSGKRPNGSYLLDGIQIEGHHLNVNTVITALNGDLVVGGAKNAVVPTSQGMAAINAYETAEYYFGDIGKSKTDKNGQVLIQLDPFFLETINTSVPYHVFVSPYGNATVWVEQMDKNSFLVKSSKPNIEFSWEIKAKRLGYEDDRLKIIQKEIPKTLIPRYKEKGIL